jgi:hypothetical protein
MHISRRMRVFKDAVLAPLVQREQLKVSTAEELLRGPDADERKVLAGRAVREAWERSDVSRVLAERANGVGLDRSVASSAERGHDVARLVGQLRGLLADGPSPISQRNTWRASKAVSAADAGGLRLDLSARHRRGMTVEFDFCDKGAQGIDRLEVAWLPACMDVVKADRAIRGVSSRPAVGIQPLERTLDGGLKAARVLLGPGPDGPNAPGVAHTPIERTPGGTPGAGPQFAQPLALDRRGVRSRQLWARHLEESEGMEHGPMLRHRRLAQVAQLLPRAWVQYHIHGDCCHSTSAIFAMTFRL